MRCQSPVLTTHTLTHHSCFDSPFLTPTLTQFDHVFTHPCVFLSVGLFAHVHVGGVLYIVSVCAYWGVGM